MRERERDGEIHGEKYADRYGEIYGGERESFVGHRWAIPGPSSAIFPDATRH